MPNQANQSLQQPAEHSFYPMPPWYPQQADDEISLVDLWLILVRQKKTIILMTVLTVGIAVAYALLATPVYEAKVTFLPPTAKDLEFLQVQGVQGVQSVSIEQAYQSFKTNLGSNHFQQLFFDQNKTVMDLPPEQSEVKNLQFFKDQLSVESDKKDKTMLAFSVRWHDAVKAAEFANAYVDMVSKSTIEQLILDQSYGIQNRIDNIQYQIDSKRKLALERRQDNIARLKEALLLAEKLNVENISATPSQINQNTIQITSLSPYLRGKGALQAEIDILEKRQSDDPFIEGLRGLQEERIQLKQVSFNEKAIQVARIDQAAFVPETRIKPKRTLIVALGLILGIMLGVFAAFMMNFIHSHKDELATTVLFLCRYYKFISYFMA